MQSPIRAALAAPILLAVAGVVPSRALQAQAVSAGPSPAVLQLDALAQERAVRWADAAPAIR